MRAAARMLDGASANGERLSTGARLEGPYRPAIRTRAPSARIPAFRERERRFEHYDRARAWERRNLSMLLKPAKAKR